MQGAPPSAAGNAEPLDTVPQTTQTVALRIRVWHAESAPRRPARWMGARDALLVIYSKEGLEVGRNERHVTPDPEGGWNVDKPGASRASSHHGTQQEAIDRARTILENSGGGELIIHNRQGEIRDSDTIPPGHDPFPPRDKR